MPWANLGDRRVGSCKQVKKESRLSGVSMRHAQQRAVCDFLRSQKRGRSSTALAFGQCWSKHSVSGARLTHASSCRVANSESPWSGARHARRERRNGCIHSSKRLPGLRLTTSCAQRCTCSGAHCRGENGGIRPSCAAQPRGPVIWVRPLQLRPCSLALCFFPQALPSWASARTCDVSVRASERVQPADTSSEMEFQKERAAPMNSGKETPRRPLAASSLGKGQVSNALVKRLENEEMSSTRKHKGVSHKRFVL